jgi:copper(I)-binding protein
MTDPLRIPRLTALACLILALLGGCGGAAENGTPTAAETAPVSVSDARIRTLIPGQDKTAAYFTIVNRGATPFVLSAVASAQARAIEIHTIERDGDMARMRRLPEVVVEPGATVWFAPGGLHLMVFGVTEPLDGFTATLVAADGQRLEVPFETIALGEN